MKLFKVFMGIAGLTVSGLASAVLLGAASGVPTEIVTVDSSTGDTALSFSTGTNINGLDQRADGTLFGASSRLFTIDVPGGNVTEIGALPDLIVSISFSPDGRLFGVNNNTDTLYEIDPLTGNQISAVGLTLSGPGSLFAPRGIEFAADGTLYGAGFDLYTIDFGTGMAVSVGRIDASPQGNGIGLLQDLDFGEDGILRGYSSGASADPTVFSNLYEINLLTGAGTQIGSAGRDMTGLATFVAPSAVPVPFSATLLAFGLLLITRKQQLI